MKLRLKYLLESLLQITLQLFRIFPIKSNRVLFSAFSGRQYSDSPKRISEMLQAMHPEYELIWAFNEPKSFSFLNAKGIKTVKFKSLEYLFYAMTCQVFVDNVEFWSILKFRPQQMVLQTWHGGGCYKRVGADRLDVSEPELQHVIKKMRKNTLFLSSCKAFSERVVKGAFGYEGEIYEIGLPRNDELIHGNGIDCDALREQLGIPHNYRIVLYAPTYRKSLSQNLYDVDLLRLRKALSQRFGGEWCIILRLHYYMSNQAFQSSEEGYIVDATAYPDMQHLLQLADVLLTDYSSTLWDFSLMYKPAFIYANDLKDYCTERNFYVPIEQWPFPRASCNDSLEDIILNFDENVYRKAVAWHHEQLGNTETGEATQLVCNRIEQIIEEGEL